MAILRVRKGKSPGAVYPVHDSTKPTLLGRDRSASITLDDNRASRRHSRILRAYGVWIIQDLGSRNGTIVSGKPAERARIDEGARIQIGNTLLSFHPAEFAPPPPDEVYGTRLLNTEREEGGVFVYRAFQSAMDREVRVDRVAPGWRLPAQVQEAVASAAEDARAVDHPGVDAIVYANVENPGNLYVVLRRRDGEPLGECFERIVKEPLETRLGLFRSIVDAVLIRSTKQSLRVPLGLHHITVSRDEGNRMSAFVPAVEMGAISTTRTGALGHLPSYVPYLAPELVRTDGGPPGIEQPSVVYGLGAIGYQLLAEEPPMGASSHRQILENHRNLEPAPANLLRPEIPDEVSDLLQRMLAKNPDERPRESAEILSTIDRALPRARAAESVPARSASALAPRQLEEPETRILEEHRAPAPAPAARQAAPPRPVRAVPAAKERSRGAPYARRPSFLNSVFAFPLWISFWILLFLGVRYLTRYFFVTFQ